MMPLVVSECTQATCVYAAPLPVSTYHHNTQLSQIQTNEVACLLDLGEVGLLVVRVLKQSVRDLVSLRARAGR
jgi:hypothetical protein